MLSILVYWFNFGLWFKLCVYDYGGVLERGKKQAETSTLNKRWFVSGHQAWLLLGMCVGRQRCGGRGFNTLFIGRAYMSALFRCLETEHFILVIIAVCDENLKKIYLGRSLHWGPKEGDEILSPILGFKKPHISALGQLGVQGQQVEGPH